MKKLFTILSALLALSLLLSACSGGGSTSATASTTAAATTAADSGAAATTAPSTEAPTAITGFMQEAGQNMPDGFDHSNNWFMDILCEMANITWAELTVPPYSDTQTKFNLMMASGTIPDFVHRADRTEMRKYGEQGAFLNINDYLANSTLINPKYSQAQFDAMKASNGNIYVLDTLPINEDGNRIFIRKDLSDAAGVTEIPIDIYEFKDVMAKVKETFPDSIVYTCRGLDYQQWFMFQPFNCGSSGWGWAWYPEENSYRMVWEGDNIIKAVEFVNSLYTEGLMDKEFITNSGEDVNQKRLSQKCFVWAQNRGGIVARMDALIADGQTDARIVAIPCPYDTSMEGYEGPQSDPSLYGGHCIAISSQTKNADAVWRFIEALYSDECYDLMIYGREGTDYQIVDGVKTPIYPSAAETSWRSVYGYAFTYNTGEALTYLTMNSIYSSNLSDEEKAEYDRLYKEGMDNSSSYLLGKRDFAPTMFLETAPDEIVTRMQDSYVEQKSLLAQAIMGEISLDEFESQKEAMVQKYSDITEYYKTELAKIDGKYDLTYNW